MILVAVITAPEGSVIDVVDDRDVPPTEDEFEEHTNRLTDSVVGSTAVIFYLVPTHPHDPDPLTAETLREAVIDHHETFATVLARKQEPVFEWKEPEPEPEPEEAAEGEAADEPDGV